MLVQSMKWTTFALLCRQHKCGSTISQTRYHHLTKPTRQLSIFGRASRLGSLSFVYRLEDSAAVDWRLCIVTYEELKCLNTVVTGLDCRIAVQMFFKIKSNAWYINHHEEKLKKKKCIHIHNQIIADSDSSLPGTSPSVLVPFLSSNIISDYLGVDIQCLEHHIHSELLENHQQDILG